MSFCNFIERLSYKKVNVEEGHSSQNHNSLINKNVKKNCVFRQELSANDTSKTAKITKR